MNRILAMIFLFSWGVTFGQEEQEINISNTYTKYPSSSDEDSKKIKSGQWKYIRDSYSVDGIKLLRQSYVDENNQVVSDFTSLHNYEDGNKTINHPKYGKIFNSKVDYFCLEISQLATTPSITKPSKNDTYYGFHDIGIYEDESGYSFTGFMLPMQTQFGNGTVLFMENESKKEYFWALLIDGKIELKIPAKKEEKPNLFQLKEQTDFELFYIPTLSKEWKKLIYVNKDLIKQEQTFNFRIPRLVSKNIETKNGYGISLTARDSIFPGDIIELKVGLFKNGKLDGLGYECRFKPYYHEMGKILYSPTGNYIQKNAEYKLQSADVKAKIGLFKEGELLISNPVSRKINVPNYWLNYDFWSRSEYPGFDGKFYNSNIVPNENDTYDFNSLKIGDQVFVKKINRTIPIVALNYQTKTIELKADLPQYKSVPFTLDNNNLYAYRKTVTNYKEYCSPTKYVQKYKSVKVKILDPPANVKTSSYTVKGVYYDKIVTTTTITPGTGEGFYITKNVKDGFETKKCFECNGLGYINRTSKGGYWCPIKYIPPSVVPKQQPQLFDKISKALKDTFKEEKTTKPAISPFSIDTQNFISQYDNDKTSNKTELKKLVQKLDLKLKSEGKSKEQITSEFVKTYNELYANNKKEYAFELMMKIPNEYISPMINSFSPEQRTYNKTKSREFISKFSGK